MASAFWKKKKKSRGRTFFFPFIAAILQLRFCRPGHHCWRCCKIHCFLWQLTDLRCILTSSDSFFPWGLQLLSKCQTWAAAGVLFENSHSTYKLGWHFPPDAGQFSLLAFSAYKLTCKILPFNIYCRKLFATIRFWSSNSIRGGADTAENWTRWVKPASSQVSGTKPTSKPKKERRAKHTIAFSGRSTSTSEWQSLLSKHLAMTQGFFNPVLHKKSTN